MFDSASLVTSAADDAFTQSGMMAQSNLQASNMQARMGSQTDQTALKATAQNFESVFLSQMFSQMFQDVGTDSLFGGGHGEEMFRSLMLDEYAKQVSKKGGLGIADAVMRQLISQQEKGS
jgi:Rod binding domain-containing protein